MAASRRYAFIGVAAAIVWYACILIFWAFQPLTDSVPVGVDYTLDTPVAVAVTVDCNSLFDSTPRDASPLPALKAQPAGKPALEFRHEPCVLVHDQGLVVFGLDTVLFAGAIAGVGWMTLRKRPRRYPSGSNSSGIDAGSSNSNTTYLAS